MLLSNFRTCINPFKMFWLQTNRIMLNIVLPYILVGGYQTYVTTGCQFLQCYHCFKSLDYKCS